MPIKKQRILLVDTSSILHHVKHSGVKSVKAKDKDSYIKFGFLIRLKYFITKTKANVCVFARDGHPNESIRRKLFPSYKIKRSDKTKKTPEQIELDKIAYPQFTEVEENILPNIGYVNIFKDPKLEADDIIGSICKGYKHCEIIIITTDQDMYQLLTDTTCIIHAQTEQYFTKAMFIKKYGIEPHMWKRVKAIAGCGTDEVPGIAGVAEKTALKYLKGELPVHHKTYEAIISDEGKKIINRNKSLVILPFRGTPNYQIKEDYVSKTRLFSVATRQKFTPILKDLDNWYFTLKGWSNWNK